MSPHNVILKQATAPIVSGSLEPGKVAIYQSKNVQLIISLWNLGSTLSKIIFVIKGDVSIFYITLVSSLQEHMNLNIHCSLSTNIASAYKYIVLFLLLFSLFHFSFFLPFIMLACMQTKTVQCFVFFIFSQDLARFLVFKHR